MKTDIRKIWDDLIMKSNTDLVEERLADLLDLRCFVGYIGITGKRLFRLALDPALSIEPNYIKQFKGVDIQMIPSTSCNYFTIILLDSDLTDVFVLFIEDLIDSLTNAANELDALNKISVRISYWKRLFAKASGSLLTFEAQRGLFGELFFIQTLLETGSNQKSTISAWKGASGANQDFAFDKSAVEVKTTKGNLPTIQISNEYQLDYREWQNLYMLLVSVTETSTGSKTLFSTKTLYPTTTKNPNTRQSRWH